ncbi:MAG: hypothetical protein NTZ69_02780 [Bacteroidia bacterium]|nr:hypothetical protein [Bacteroidia bacterium]
MKQNPTFLDNFFFKSRILIKNRKRIMYSSASGILLGMMVNTMSSPELSKSFSAIFNNIFQVQNRPLNYLSWISLSMITIIPLAEMLLRFHYKKRRLESLFQNLLKNRIDQEIIQFSDGRITIGSSLTLQQTPEIIEGWKVNEIGIFFDSKRFEIPKVRLENYKEYYKANYTLKGFDNDGTKFMIIKKPWSCTDSPNLKIELQECNYSQVQFYKDIIVPKEKENLIKTIFNDLSISFPHSICLHLIIVTRDRKVLTTLRSPEVGYYPNKWSVSVEEQLNKNDFVDGPENVIKRWLKRLLEEEIGIDESDYNISNFRLLSLFLESEIMNCSLCGLVKLEISSEELKKILQAKPKKDKEFTKCIFLSYSELKKEFLQFKNDFLIPSNDYHPSSIYRIFMTLLHKYGPISIINEIWKKNNNSVKQKLNVYKKSIVTGNEAKPM